MPTVDSFNVPQPVSILVGGKPVKLTRQQIDLLVALLYKPNQVVYDRHILPAMSRMPFGHRGKLLIKVQVCRVRKALENAQAGARGCVVSVDGRRKDNEFGGYMFVPNPDMPIEVV